MVRARECEFCGEEIEAGTGTMFVRVDGATDYYCSSKCEKAADLGREPRDLGWTEAGRDAAAANRREEGRRADEAADEAAEAEAEAAAEAEEAAEAESDAADGDEAAEEADDAEADAADAETEEVTEE